MKKNRGKLRYTDFGRRVDYSTSISKLYLYYRETSPLNTLSLEFYPLSRRDIKSMQAETSPVEKIKEIKIKKNV